MRVLFAVAFLVVTSVAAFTYRDLLLGRNRTVQRPSVKPMVTMARSQPAPAVAATIDSLAAVDSAIDTYIVAIQESPNEARAMIDLAFFYMTHGWFDRAIGPLARAREIDPSSEPLRRYLELAVARSGNGYVDLTRAAREFDEVVEMWGHGC